MQNKEMRIRIVLISMFILTRILRLNSKRGLNRVMNYLRRITRCIANKSTRTRVTRVAVTKVLNQDKDGKSFHKRETERERESDSEREREREEAT